MSTGRGSCFTRRRSRSREASAPSTSRPRTEEEDEEIGVLYSANRITNPHRTASPHHQRPSMQGNIPLPIEAGTRPSGRASQRPTANTGSFATDWDPTTVDPRFLSNAQDPVVGRAPSPPSQSVFTGSSFRVGTRGESAFDIGPTTLPTTHPGNQGGGTFDRFMLAVPRTNAPQGIIIDAEFAPGHLAQYWRSRGTKYICTFEGCGEEFKNRYNTDIHIRRHLNLPPFACELCSLGFPESIQLDRHHTIEHLGKMVFKCWKCSIRFGERNTLHRHERTHIGGNVQRGRSRSRSPSTTRRSSRRRSRTPDDGQPSRRGQR